jgi:hypothetical protein
MRRLYTVDEVLDLLSESVSAEVSTRRRRRASRILAKLPEATLRQARIAAGRRLDQALSKLLGYEVRAGGLVPSVDHRSRR